MNYQKIQPYSLLTPFVESIWVQESDVPAAGTPTTVLPTTTMDPLNSILKITAISFKDIFDIFLGIQVDTRRGIAGEWKPMVQNGLPVDFFLNNMYQGLTKN